MSDHLQVKYAANDKTLAPDLDLKQQSTGQQLTAEERYYLASQWQLMWQKFRRHRLALIGTAILAVLYLAALFAEPLAPYGAQERLGSAIYHPPTGIHIRDAQGNLRWPFVYGTAASIDMKTLQRVHQVDPSIRHPIRFFVQGTPYRFLGFIPSDIHLFGVEEPGRLFLLGADGLGRDLFTRTIYGARISLTIGLVGVGLSFIIGVILGGISGYFGGHIDTVIQRIIEVLISLPTIPLWMALSAALPRHWSVLQVYFGIVVILSLVGWGGLARVVRGKLLELRELDYVMAARIIGMDEYRIIWSHLLPNFASYLIVYVTLAIPGMILAETALSFLGLGLRPPALSWGVLLEGTQNIHSVALYPWMIIPAFFVILAVMAFNFMGDGLRDAADPYKL